MHISNGSTFKEVTQVCSNSQQKNITLWMLGYERSTSLVLLDKSTQSESRHISLVQVDLEQIKYIIQSTFLYQSEIQRHR